MLRQPPHSGESADESINIDKQRAAQLRGQPVLIKYGGNAMVREEYKQAVINDICRLQELGVLPVVVHGGGPAIAELLDEVSLESDFVGGHRKTTGEMMGYVEMALSGKVNGEIVKLLGARGCRAVGLSGKDGGMVVASRRVHEIEVDGKIEQTDLGHVGDVKKINTDLILAMLNEKYLPVIAPIGVGEDLEDYNINADMFAGHLAGALAVSHYVVLTDVDGLRRDKNDPATLIHDLSATEARKGIGGIVAGGMIPKVESCLIALETGAASAHIVSGLTPHAIRRTLLTSESLGTRIHGS